MYVRYDRRDRSYDRDYYNRDFKSDYHKSDQRNDREYKK